MISTEDFKEMATLEQKLHELRCFKADLSHYISNTITEIEYSQYCELMNKFEHASYGCDLSYVDKDDTKFFLSKNLADACLTYLNINTNLDDVEFYFSRNTYGTWFSAAITNIPRSPK